jgi:formylglycine-generating enzyme required for sulfatase activity
LGFFDLLGNVNEWVADWYDPDYYARRPDPDANPINQTPNQFRAIRGASWLFDASYARFEGGALFIAACFQAYRGRLTLSIGVPEFGTGFLRESRTGRRRREHFAP